MLENGLSHPNAFHLAGIVPVSVERSDFGMEWSDCLTPIAPNYTAIERAVTECAWAGCETIWIVCNDDVSPLIRHRLGEFVMDPVYFNRMDPFPSQRRKRIPLYYVPIHPYDRGRRDCLPWSILYGAYRAFKVCDKISKYLAPRMYYVAFPQAVYPIELIRPHRKDISSVRPFFLRYQGNTIKNGSYLGFSFDEKGYKHLRDIVRMRRKDLINEELLKGKNPAKHFKLDTIFQHVIMEEAKVVEVPWYHPIDNWDNYCAYLGSEDRKTVKHPGPHILKYHEYNRIGYEPDDD
jgi:hypothetical protein